MTTKEKLRSGLDTMFDAARNGDIKKIDKAIEDGVDITGTNQRGWNVLHYICLYKQYTLLRHVVMKHTNVVNLVNKVTVDGTTPLHMSCTPHPPDIRVIEALVRLGGDLIQRDSEGKSCKDKTHDRNVWNYLSWREIHPSGLPDSVIENQTTADNNVIMKYLRTFSFMDDGFARRYEKALTGRIEKSANIRVIFLGHEGVGKTTLVLRLLGKKVPEGGPESTNVMDVELNRILLNKRTGERTHYDGCDIERSVSLIRLRDVLRYLTLDDKGSETGQSYSGDNAYVNIFDFGGEYMFSHFQHVFLNADAVIVLVFSLHNCLDKLKILKRISFWLKFIATYSLGKFMPPVLLIGTHLDKVPKAERNQTADFVIDIIKSVPYVKEIYDKQVVGFFQVDSSEPNPSGYENIWQKILKVAPYQSQWGQLLPGNWIKFEHDLMTLKHRKKRVMSFREIEQRGHLFDISDVPGFLRYMHSTRSILCFQTNNQDKESISPDQNIVIDPEWVIKAFRCIITDIKFHQERLGSTNPLLKEYKRTKSLTRAFIDHVWGLQEGIEEGFLKHSSTLLFYIERLELIVKPLQKDGEPDVDMYIVPSLLEEADPKLLRSYLLAKNIVTSSTFCIQFKGKFVPEAVHDKMMASLIYRFELASVPIEGNTVLLRRGLACFTLTGFWKMILHAKDQTIKITLFSESSSCRDNCEGNNVRCILTNLLMATLSRNDQAHLEYDMYLHDDFEVRQGDELVSIPKRKKYAAETRAKQDFLFWFREVDIENVSSDKIICYC